jgi:hypothetical protein
MSGFQTQAAYNPAPAVEGDFASTNPRTTVMAAAGALVAGALGVIVGRFAWKSYAQVDSDNAPAVVNNFGTGPVAGFIHREQQGLIEQYLQESTMLVPAGFPMTVFDGGDFWVKNNGATPALDGMKVYANYADGKATAAVTGAPNGATTSAGSIAAATSGFAASIVGNVLNVTAVNSGTIYPAPRSRAPMSPPAPRSSRSSPARRAAWARMRSAFPTRTWIRAPSSPAPMACSRRAAPSQASSASATR